MKVLHWYKARGLEDILTFHQEAPVTGRLASDIGGCAAVAPAVLGPGLWQRYASPGFINPLMLPSLSWDTWPRNQVTSGFGIPETTGPGEGREASKSACGVGVGDEGTEPEGWAQLVCHYLWLEPTGLPFPSSPRQRPGPFQEEGCQVTHPVSRPARACRREDRDRTLGFLPGGHGGNGFSMVRAKNQG